MLLKCCGFVRKMSCFTQNTSFCRTNMAGDVQSLELRSLTCWPPHPSLQLNTNCSLFVFSPTYTVQLFKNRYYVQQPYSFTLLSQHRGMKSNHYLCEEEDTTAETLRYEDKSMRTHTVYTALHQVLFDLTKPPLWIPTLFDGLMMQWSGVLYSVWASIFSSPLKKIGLLAVM